MSSRLRIPLLLSGMMFLQYAVWGSWMPILSGTLSNRGIEPQNVGYVYSGLWLACIISPFLGGQLADRFMPSQVFLAISHLIAAGAAFVMAQQTSAFTLVAWMFLWSLLFAPTLGITNSVAFFHIDRAAATEADKERIFAWVRTFGTIGWIVAAFLLVWYMNATGADPKAATGPIPEMQLTGVLGIAMAVYCLLLPNTPPATGERADPLAFREALGMFKLVPGFAVFMLISFVAATEFQFFYLLSAPYLEDLAIPHRYIPIVKSISQVAEIGALALLLPLWLPKLGMKWCLIIGSLAWPIRYLIFAIGEPVELVVASLALHGFGYAFVLVVQQLYVDRVAPKDIRASAQSLLTLVTLGVGNLLGTLFSGAIQQHFTENGKTNWAPVFLLPAVLTLICAVAYWLTFKEPKETEGAAEGTAATPAAV